MYEERKETFSFKSFFLTVLVVLLFTFLMLWLFPTKSYISGNKGTNTYDLDRLSVLYDEIFANNVERMKNAAIGYYTNERMPQVVGQSKKMTLQEMYDLHLVLQVQLLLIKQKKRKINTTQIQNLQFQMSQIYQIQNQKNILVKL